MADNEVRHSLYAFEEDFLEDGTRAVCMCGWESDLQIDINKAIQQLKARQAWKQHEKENN